MNLSGITRLSPKTSIQPWISYIAEGTSSLWYDISFEFVQLSRGTESLSSICGIIELLKSAKLYQRPAIRWGAVSELEPEDRINVTDGLARVLAPLAKLCIRYEVTYAELTEMMKIAFVESAQNDHHIPESELTDARVAVLTGLSRKAVRNVKESMNEQEARRPLPPSRMQRVIKGWLTDDEFLTETREPLVLPIKSANLEIEEGSFVALVKRYSGDITYGAVLDELNRAELIEQPSKYEVKLINNAYVPQTDELEKAKILCDVVSSMFNDAVNNLDRDAQDKTRQRQNSVQYIDESLVPELKQLINEGIDEMLESLNNPYKKALNESKRLREKGEESESPRKRIGVGFYYIDEERKPKK